MLSWSVERERECVLAELANTGQRILIGDGFTHVSFGKMFFDRRAVVQKCLAYVNMGQQVIGFLQHICFTCFGIDCIRDRVLRFLWGAHPAGQVYDLACLAKRCLLARVDAQELKRAVDIKLHGMGGRAAVEQARRAASEAAVAVVKGGI